MMKRTLFLMPMVVTSGWAGVEADLPEDNQVTGEEEPGFSLFGGEQEFDVEYEGLYAGDIEVHKGSLRYVQRRGDWNFEAGFSVTDYAISYQPFLPLGGMLGGLDETTTQGALTVGYAINETLETSLAVSAYDGFADYRSIWIAEYYRQTFNFPGSGYEAPDPHGFSVTSGWVWTPSFGTKVSFDLHYGEDTIAPGWSFQDPGNDLLKSRGVAIRWEQAINPRLKTETSFTYTDITDREARMNLQSSWNFAWTDSLTLGGQIGGSMEDPDFESLYGGLSLTYEVNPHLSLSVSGRLYDDTGEIETSGFNSSAPGVQTAEVGISALYEVGSHSLRIGVSHYLTDYGEPDPGNEFFTHLYEDRDWWTVRTAYSFQF